jgi:hypothetical protein
MLTSDRSPTRRPDNYLPSEEIEATIQVRRHQGIAPAAKAANSAAVR